MCFIAVFLAWPLRRWFVAAATAAAAFLILGLTSAVIENPLFGRTEPPTPWSMDVLVLTSILIGLLTATYVRSASVPTEDDDRPAREGLAGAVLTYLAIGCPVCNKLVVVALGSVGAVEFFAPVQPYLAAAGLLVLVWALYVRLRGEATCAWKPPPDLETDAGSTSHAESAKDPNSELVDWKEK